MNTKRKILFRAGAVLLLVLIAGAMFIIGRGHTVYLDNKSIEYNGQTYEAPYRAIVFVDGEQVARLADDERGMSICIGPKFTMSLTVIQEKDGDEQNTTMTIRMPQNMDGVIINLPALLAGLSEEAYLSEMIIQTVDSIAEDEEIITDEFAILEDDMEIL